MSKRLQVLIPDDEFGALRAAAEARRMTLSDWVRASLREAVAARSSSQPDERIAAIRTAAAHQFPAPDIDVMLREIEAGYLPPP
jgi:hypothetical protein